MRLFDLVENENKNLVVIYPGRFHPFHIGHGKVFKYLKQNYKGAQVFIASSGKTDTHKSPFTFDEKKKMMMLAGVDPNAVVQTKVPYVATEITDRFDPDTTVVVYAVSEKDMAEDPRFDFPQNGPKLKKNGEPAHVQKWTGMADAKPLRDHSYIVTVPTFTFKIRGESINSATQIRNMIAKADETELTQILQDLYGRSDIPSNVVTIFQRKLQSNVMSENWEEVSLYESLLEAEIYFEILNERKLTGGEKRSKETHFKKLKKHKSDFVDRYGDEAESIMHAVATKRAKKESHMKISDIIITEEDWDFSQMKKNTQGSMLKSKNKSDKEVDPLKVAGAAAAAGIPASMIGRKIGKDVVRDIKGDGPEDRRARERFKKDIEKKLKKTPSIKGNTNTNTKPSSAPSTRKLPGVTRSGGAGMIVNPRRTIGGGGRIEPKLRNNPLNMFNEISETNIIEEITLEDTQDFHEEFGYLAFCEEGLFEAEYQGRKVKLNKPMRGDVKKFKVYVKNDKGNVVKVNFGDPDMKIKKSNPKRRKSFRARHNCDNPGPKTKARYWSCRKW